MLPIHRHFYAGLLLCALAFFTSKATAQLTHFTSDFTEAEHRTDASPYSPAWIANAPGVIDFRDGALLLTPRGTPVRHAVIKFNADDKPVMLGVSEGLLLSFTVSFRGAVKFDPNALRFGLIDTQQSRLVPDRNDAVQASGYIALLNPGNSSLRFIKRLPVTAPLISSLSNVAFTSETMETKTGTSGPAIQVDTTYQISFSISRTTAERLDLGVSITGQGLERHNTASETSQAITRFDSLIIAIGAGAPGGIAIREVVVMGTP